jgi:hypothetical protein
VPIIIMGLASFQTGRGSPARFFYSILLVCAGLPLPTRLQVYQSEVVYNDFRSDTRQDRKDMKKAIPSLYPSWLFSWAMRVLPHKKCLVRQFANVHPPHTCVLTPLKNQRRRPYLHLLTARTPAHTTMTTHWESRPTIQESRHHAVLTD